MTTSTTNAAARSEGNRGGDTRRVASRRCSAMTRTARMARIMVLSAAMLALWSTAASAQEAACPDGSEGNPWIGVHAFHCPGGTCSAVRLYVAAGDGQYTELRTTDLPVPIDRSAQAVSYEFSAEPWLRGIDSGGPAAGVLEEGDTLVAVNGYLITSSRGGRELGTLPLDADARLTVRRDDRLVEVTLRPIRHCELPLAMTGNTMLRLPYDRLGYSDRWNYTVSRDGTIGASFRCDDCSFTVSGDGDLTWDNPQLLELVAVEQGGPADLAGLLPGDVLLEINGLDLTTDVAADLLLNPDAGTTLDLLFDRDGQQLQANLTITLVEESRDPREDFVVYRDKTWGDAFSGFFGDWLTNDAKVDLRPEFTVTMSGDSWGPSAYGSVFSWCDDCTWTAAPDFGWQMAEYPVVASVTEGGPAARAGLQPGDVLTHVDGRDLRTQEGGSAFINLRTGDEVEIRFLRDGEEQTATLVAGEMGD